MKKRFFAILMASVFCFTGLIAGKCQVQAQDISENVAFSTILTEDALVGYMNMQTRGVYLAEGYSAISDSGGGKIGCLGITNAAKRCKVTVNVIVEKKVNGSWTRVTSWTATNTNALTASISKTLSVGSGYYYRVRSLHYAGTDSSSSFTEGMWM